MNKKDKLIKVLKEMRATQSQWQDRVPPASYAPRIAGGGSPSTKPDSNINQRMQTVAGQGCDCDILDPENDCAKCSSIGRAVKRTIESDTETLKAFIRESVGAFGATYSDGWEQNRRTGLGMSEVEEPGFLKKYGADIAQGALDICGLFPGAGEVCDLTNVIIYLSREKYLYAGLQLISVIPVIGDAVGKGGKYATITAKALSKTPKAFQRYAAKAGPKFAKFADEVKEVQDLIKNNWSKVDKVLDTLEQIDYFEDDVSKMREALSVFSGRESPKTEVGNDVQDLVDIINRTLKVSGKVVDEDDDEFDGDSVDEFSSIAGGSIAGYTGPLGAAPPKVGKRKRKKPESAQKGFKKMHG